jgi:hypothetical protein
MLLATEAERDRLASAVAEFEKEAAVLQLLLETLEVAEGEAKTRYLAPVVSRVEPYLKMLLPEPTSFLMRTCVSRPSSALDSSRISIC